MAATGRGRGIDIVMGVVKQVLWTAVGVDTTVAGAAIRPTSFSYDEAVEELPDESYNGNPQRNDTTNTGRYRVSGTFGFDCKPMGLTVPLALFFGTDGLTDANPNYTHLLSINDDMANMSATIAWYDGVATHEIGSAKFTRLVLRGTAGGVMTGELGWIGDQRLENTATNAVEMPGLTELATVDRIPITNTVTTYQIDAKGGSSMATIALSSWEVTFERTYDDDDRVFTSTAAPYRDEPEAGRFSCTGSVTVAPYAATTQLDSMVAGTLHEMQLLHVVTAATKAFNIFLPSIKFITGGVNPGDFGAIPLPMAFVCDLAGTAMTESGKTGPAVQLINQTAALGTA